MKTYIRNTIKGYFVEFPEEIDKEYWEGKIGDTYEDFLDGKWVLLTDKQVQFHAENPGASIEEVINTQLIQISPRKRTTIVRELSLEEAKNDKINILKEYYNSTYNISINGTICTLSYENIWKLQVILQSALELNGDLEESYNITLVFDNLCIDYDIYKDGQTLKNVLANIILYLNKCDSIFIQHKNAISKLETIEEVNNYEVTSDFPKLMIVKL